MDIPFIGDILEFFQSVWDWIYSGIYDFVKEAFVLATKMAIYSYLNLQLLLLDIAYDVFSELVEGLGIGNQLRNYYNSISPDIRDFLSFLGIPQAFNIIFSAIGTRWAMRFIPFIGK